MRKDLVFWNIPVTKTLDDLLESAIRADTHVSKSDLIREAVREKLLKMGFEFRFTEAENPAE